MTLTQVKDWLKSQIDVGDGIEAGGVNGNKERFIGVYPLRGGGRQRVCVGGPGATGYQEARVSILVHWTRSMAQAERKAREVYNLFYGLVNADMGGARVFCADPGGGPIPVGKDARGVCEFVIEVTLRYERAD